MSQHAPGIVCIVHGIQASWPKLDNGKFVVIVKLYRESRIFGRFWAVRPYDPMQSLHGYKNGTPVLSKQVATMQKNLIPLGPEHEMELNHDPINEQARPSIAEVDNAGSPAGQSQLLRRSLPRRG